MRNVILLHFMSEGQIFYCILFVFVFVCGALFLLRGVFEPYAQQRFLVCAACSRPAHTDARDRVMHWNHFSFATIKYTSEA